MAPADPNGAPMPDRIGRYELRERLGIGGMGVVYAAYDPELRRELAVKVLRTDRMRGDPERARRRLREEAQVTASLSHPNVVTIYDVGESDGAVFVAMELVRGSSLDLWIHAAPHPWTETLRMFAHAGRGLAAAHEIGLIHRDFKPANVLIGEDRRPRVVDFGIAHVGIGDDHTVDVREVMETHPAGTLGVSDQQRLASAIGRGSVTHETLEGTGAEQIPEVVAKSRADKLAHEDPDLQTSPEDVVSTGWFAGTPAYMAPELFTGAPADAKSDQFAFCVGLFEGVYFERPFVGETPDAIADAVLKGHVRPPPDESRVPPWLWRILERGLALNPDERHESMKSLLASIWFTARVLWGLTRSQETLGRRCGGARNSPERSRRRESAHSGHCKIIVASALGCVSQGLDRPAQPRDKCRSAHQSLASHRHLEKRFK